MNVEEIRLLNLQLLIEEFGSKAAISRLADTPANYLSQIVNRVPSRTGKPRDIGTKLARKLEVGCGKTFGWMDTPHLSQISDRPSQYANGQNLEPGPELKGLVPLISWVRAGTWHEAEDHFLSGDGEQFLPCPASHGPHTYALKVTGDSMTSPHGKSYPAGCIIYVDPDQRGGIANGDRVIAKLSGDNAITFKVFIEDAGKRFLKPLNPQYPVIADEFRILGKVIGKWEDE